MTNIRNILGEQADIITRDLVNIGDVHKLPLTPEEGITPKDGKKYRNKFFVVLGFNDIGDIIGGVVVNSKINHNLPSSITDYLMPVSVSQCTFLSHNSFINCSHLLKAQPLQYKYLSNDKQRTFQTEPFHCLSREQG